jgi:hypothetical protein
MDIKLDNQALGGQQVRNFGDVQNANAWLGVDTQPPTPTISAYPGHIDSSGSTLSPIPAGWSCTRVSTGLYRVTHNLGTMSYAVTATAVGNPYVLAIDQIATTYFQINIHNLSNSLVNNEFEFILIPQ